MSLHAAIMNIPGGADGKVPMSAGGEYADGYQAGHRDARHAAAELALAADAELEQQTRHAIYEAEAAQLTAPLRARVAQLEAAEEGAKVAFSHVVDTKQAAEKECIRLRALLDAAYAQIRGATQDAAAERERCAKLA